MTAAITTLIVDDEMDMRLLVRTVLMLSKDGFNVVGEAADGIEALARYEELDPPPHPEVVIVDNRMPNMGGIELATRLRSMLPDQPIILFSAYLDDDVLAQAEALGIDACLSKGDLDRLPEVIRDVVASR